MAPAVSEAPKSDATMSEKLCPDLAGIVNVFGPEPQFIPA